jgi:hypothetical protein
MNESKRGQNRTQSLQSVDDEDEDDQEIDVIDDKNFSQVRFCHIRRYFFFEGQTFSLNILQPRVDTKLFTQIHKKFL